MHPAGIGYKSYSEQVGESDVVSLLKTWISVKSLRLGELCSTIRAVLNVIRSLILAVLAFFRTRGQLAAEILALRHQLGVLRRSVKRPRLTNADRGLWALLSRFWGRWQDSLIIVKPATVIEWHRAGFREYWTWRSRPKGGRPRIDPEVRALIKRMATANMWGAPRIHGELLKLGIRVSQATVSKYMPRRRKPPSQTWRTLLDTYPMLPVSQARQNMGPMSKTSFPSTSSPYRPSSSTFCSSSWCWRMIDGALSAST